MGGKSKKQTIGYKYYLGQHLVFCHGPIDAITRATVDDRVAWTGHSTGGQISINKEEIFGGSSREGGVSGTIDIEMGGPAQGQNSYLLSKLGSLIPSYRGVVGAVFRQCYLGNNPYLKPWRFRGQRILTRQNGIAQWYPEKAVVVGLQIGSTPYASYDFDLSATANATTNQATAMAIGYTINVNSPYDVLVITLPEGRTYQAYTYDGEEAKTGPGNSGSSTQLNAVRDGGATTNGIVGEGYYNGVVGNSNMYNSFAEARADFGERQMTGASEYAFYIYDSPVSTNTGGLSVHIDVYHGGTIDMNPAHIIRECLTDPDWGMGYNDSDIDDASFEAAADTLFEEGLGVSLLWDRQILLEDFVGEILKHCDGALYVSRTTGKFVLKLIRRDYDEGSLVLLDESNIDRIEDPKRPSFGELVNSVSVKYWSAVTGKDASVTVTDTALAQVQGAVINTTLQFPGFANSRNATIAAQRALRSLSSPNLSCTIYCDSTAKELNVGDAFKLSWSRWGVVETVMRITGIAYGNGRNNQIRIECTQDSFDTDTNIVVSVPDNEWSNPSEPPSPSNDQLATEAPYYEVVQVMGQADTDNKLLTHPEIGYVIAAASRAEGAINARMWSDTGSGYEEVATLDFCPTATLVDAITPTQTSFTVENMDDLEEVLIGSHFQIDEELLRIDSIDTGTGVVTVGRGVLDTVPEPHLAGAMLFFWDQYAGFDAAEYVDSETVDVKITPVSGAGVLPIEDAIPMTVELDQRAARPYPPGDLRINADSYLDPGYEGELTVTWTDRDRLQQTAGVLIDHTAGNIGPEVGTTYRLRTYIDDVLDQTIEPATTPQLVTPAGEGLVRIEVDSLRDGLYSWQAANHEFYYLATGLLATEDDEVRATEDGDIRATED